MSLNKWPPPSKYMRPNKSYILVTWDDLYTDKTRPLRFQNFVTLLNNSGNWEYYIPDHLGGFYGALFSSENKASFLSEVALVENIREKNGMIFSKMECKPCVGDQHAKITPKDYVKKKSNEVVPRHSNQKKQSNQPKKSKTQSVLVNKKPGKKRYSHAQMAKFKADRELNIAEGARNDKEYDARMKEDPEFAEREKKRKLAAKEAKRVKREKKRKSAERTKIFGHVFGTDDYQGKWRQYFDMFGSSYMPIGGGKFFNMDDCSIKDRDDFYEVGENGKMIAVKRRGIVCNFDHIFADAEKLPKYDDYEWWYRTLPIHIGFITDEEKKDIYYMAPKEDQPNYPFVYISWMIDEEESSYDSVMEYEGGGQSDLVSSPDEKEGKMWGDRASSSDDSSVSGDDSDNGPLGSSSVKKGKRKCNERVIHDSSDDD